MPAWSVRRALLAIAALALPACIQEGPPLHVTVVEGDAWGSDWSHAANLVATNKRGSDGDYHLMTMTVDGKDERLFGAGNPDMPRRNTGSPAWHPSGKYLVFVAEKAEHDGPSALATPGWGGYSDLWIATADGSRVWQLTSTPDDGDHGTLIPLFSPDGTRLAWAERTQGANLLDPRLQMGAWVLEVADFVDDPSGPSLAHVRHYAPGGAGFNETGGFTPDGQGMLFTSDYETGSVWKNQIYRLDLATGASTRLTTDGYNEHPRFTPDGRILWMSDVASTLGGADWWIMNADGTGKKRLSFFNEPLDVESSGHAVWTGPVPTENWTDNGRAFLGDVETNLLTTDGQIRRVLLLGPPN